MLGFAAGAAEEELGGGLAAAVVGAVEVDGVAVEGALVGALELAVAVGCAVVLALGLIFVVAVFVLVLAGVAALGGVLLEAVALAGCEDFGAGALATTAGCAATGAAGTTVFARYLSQSELVPLESRYFCLANCARLSPAGVPLVRFTERARRLKPSA